MAGGLRQLYIELSRVLAKRALLKTHLIEFESIVHKYEHRLSTEDWNKLTDDFEFVKTRVKQSLKILDGTVVIPKKENKRERRNTDYYIEVKIPETTNNYSIPVEESQLWEELPFTSSFIISGSEKYSLNALGNSTFKSLTRIDDIERYFPSIPIPTDATSNE